jgi:hypothetical protein
MAKTVAQAKGKRLQQDMNVGIGAMVVKMRGDQTPLDEAVQVVCQDYPLFATGICALIAQVRQSEFELELAIEQCCSHFGTQQQIEAVAELLYQLIVGIDCEHPIVESAAMKLYRQVFHDLNTPRRLSDQTITRLKLEGFVPKLIED